jgi:hypothetical protein
LTGWQRRPLTNQVVPLFSRRYVNSSHSRSSNEPRETRVALVVSGSVSPYEAPSGAGKTLLLRAIADLDPSDGLVSPGRARPLVERRSATHQGAAPLAAPHQRSDQREPQPLACRQAGDRPSLRLLGKPEVSDKGKCRRPFTEVPADRIRPPAGLGRHIADQASPFRSGDRRRSRSARQV